jgi:hypothetical protein
MRGAGRIRPAVDHCRVFEADELRRYESRKSARIFVSGRIVGRSDKGIAVARVPQ